LYGWSHFHARNDDTRFIQAPRRSLTFFPAETDLPVQLHGLDTSYLDSREAAYSAGEAAPSK
jgi:hypothetical protein